MLLTVAVVRMTKDQLLNLRKPTKILESMTGLTGIISLLPLKPLILEPFDHEEVCIWFNIFVACLNYCL